VQQCDKVYYKNIRGIKSFFNKFKRQENHSLNDMSYFFLKIKCLEQDAGAATSSTPHTIFKIQSGGIT
jgi:hypothetical protein